MPSIPEIVDVAKAVEDSEVIRDVGHAQGVVNEAVPPNESEDKQGTEDDVDEEMPPAESVVPLGADKDSKVFSAAEHPQAVVHLQATAAVQHPQQASMLFQSVEPDGQGKEIVRPDVNAGLPTTEAVIPPPAVNDSGVIAAIEHPQATVHLQDVLSNGEGNESAAIPRVGDKCGYCSEVFRLGEEVLVQETLCRYRFEFCCRKCMVREDLTLDDGVIRAVERYEYNPSPSG